MYDIFFLSSSPNLAEFNRLKILYPRIQLVNTPTSFTELKNKSFTKMFWVIYDNLILSDNFDLNNYRATKWDNMYVHVFKNKEYYDGICLFPKSSNLSNREFEKRFFINKKEVDIVASNPIPYKKYNIANYTNYLEISKETSTNMFWAIWDDVIPLDNFKFDYQVPYFEQGVTHIFRNGKHYDGICLFSKHNQVSPREFENRFFNIKKELNIIASMPAKNVYDIVFISYNEPNADENYNKLINKFPRAKRVNGVTGIHQAHIEAAKIVTTEMFYVVDGDAIIEETYNFDYVVPSFEKNHVHVWRSCNPVNGLEYGYGGIKLLPTAKTLAMNINTADMTTSISDNFKAMPAVSNTTSFNTDPFNSWKSAFRECVKLSSRIIDRQKDDETQIRLDTWCTTGNDPNVIVGAIAGRDYGSKNRNNKEALKKINDFDWLHQQFKEANE